MNDRKTLLNDLHGDAAWFVIRNGAAVIQVEYGGKVYETAMVEQSPVGFPKEAE